MAQSYAGLVCYMAWVSSVFAHPPAKRAVAIALINAVSQLGNVAGSCVLSCVLLSFSLITVQLRMAKGMGSILPLFLRHLHRMPRSNYCRAFIFSRTPCS